MFQFGAVVVGIVSAAAVAKWRGEATEDRLGKLENAFRSHQLEVVEKYVSNANFEKFEAEIKESLKQLTVRIDQLLARRGR